MNLFIKLITAQNGISSKRFMSLIAFAFLIIVIVSDVWFGQTVEQVVYYTLGGIILGESGMTVLQDTSYNKLNQNNELK